MFSMFSSKLRKYCLNTLFRRQLFFSPLSDHRASVLAFSLFFNAAHCFMYATIWTYDAIYPIMVATGIGRIGTAAMAALTSQHVNAAMQGQTQVSVSVWDDVIRFEFY